ncbi:tyrosine-type recombinase/integrase [Paraburkholderia sp. BR10923]|uniref:tyrosine-type recombinase/integrase n=1 Tax=Paraburkholderia sp. BR10923 TaxID=3236992 RepID=UPI0034CE80C3
MKMHITEQALNNVTVPAGKDKLVVFDQEQTGFAASITPKGTMSYVIVYRNAQGKQRQEKIAAVGSVSANAARAMARTQLASIAATRGETLAPRRPSCPTVDTFFFNTYLPVLKNNGRQHSAHTSIYRNHVQPVFGQRRLDEISTQDIVAFNTHLREKVVAGGRWQKQSSKPLAEGTVKRVLILVRHLFNEAIKAHGNVVRQNPTHTLKLTSERKVKGRFLTKSQLCALLKAAEASSNVHLANILRVMGTTGLRRENVLAMQWAWFDAERGTLTVPAEADKARKGFTLYLSGDVLGLLRKLQESAEGPWVFPNPKTGKPYYSCYDAWVTACNKAGLPGLRMHDLRHTYASMMLESGSDIVDVQRALGHTQLKTTAVYLHLTEGRKRARADAAAQATGLFA